MERQIPLRLHEAQYNKVKEKAAEKGMKVAPFIRAMIDKLK